MRKRTRRAFTAAVKQEAVRICEGGDRSIAQVAKDLDLTDRHPSADHARVRGGRRAGLRELG